MKLSVSEVLCAVHHVFASVMLNKMCMKVDTTIMASTRGCVSESI